MDTDSHILRGQMPHAVWDLALCASGGGIIRADVADDAVDCRGIHIHDRCRSVHSIAAADVSLGDF